MTSQLPANVHVVSDLQKLAKTAVEGNFSQVYILVDENTNIHCLPILQEALLDADLYFFYLEVPAGESSKDISTCTSLWESLSEEFADRKTLLLNLGGGVVTDLGAFVASLYKRGISFYNIPTSLLAMVDAAVGGKCGIDFNGFKNQIGVFNQAEETYIFPHFLNTLPEQEFWSGMAEMYKHALIADAQHWKELKKCDTTNINASIIERSVAIKAAIVTSDPLEKGERKKLNFGHTIGHAIESYFMEIGAAIPHGFAVAAGMVCEAHLSVQKNKLSLPDFDELEEELKQHYTSLKLDKVELSKVMEYLQQDKKTENGILQFTLLERIGKSIINQQVESHQIETALAYYFEHEA